MFANFLKVTLRNLYREKVYAVINIAGLSIAIASCIILGLYLKREFTYDRHNKNYKQIFRIINTNALGNGRYVSSDLGPSLANGYSEIIEYVRFAHMILEGETLVRHGDKAFKWTSIYYADDNVFNVFTHDIIYGDPKTALIDSKSVAVNESFSKKYFANANPIGETITLKNNTYKITLVFADLPDNASLKYDILLSYHEKELSNAKTNEQTFQRIDCMTYLLMPSGYKAQDFKSISDSIYSRYIKKGLQENEYRFWLQPMTDIHFNSDITGESTANKFYIYGFIAVAVFILLVACINYMNLATARAAKRAKEVGIRKILGADRTSLSLQFMGEAVFFSLIALFLGLVLSELALNLTSINDLQNKHLTLDLSHEPSLILWMLCLSLIVGLMSGLYPAFYLSSMPSLSALVHSRQAEKGNIRLRELLILIQFTITVIVIACTLLIALQMSYVTKKPLGFEKENRLFITLFGEDVINKIPTIKNELMKNSSIFEITQSDSIAGLGVGKIAMAGTNNEIEKMSILKIDDNYLKVMGIKLVSGRDFSKKLLTDVRSSAIINEAMVKAKGWTEPLGQSVLNFQVIGVVKDFHFASLHSPVEPLGMVRLNDSILQQVAMRQLILYISGENISKTLKFLEENFAEFDPKHPFQYEFLDDALDLLYLSEMRLMKMTGIFGGVCILISCMGLFGLAAFTTNQRTKEIGVRKVLGATTLQIIIMLSRRILLLVLGGSIIASAVTFYVIDEWLTSFAYRTGINPLVFVISAAAAAGVAFITVALQSYGTAKANPVETLRYE